ncbi:MAG: hypothetical protein BHW37_02130 [Firmicutes bacterium CAG:272_52_7]|nr:MAG: hypothetical protein BHW37_02130 [Firmicutes bacterium CAG:272_52_7]
MVTQKRKKSSGGVVIDGVEGLAVKFAKCCNPLPGDPVIGFITKGYGISIHKQDCPNVISGLNNPIYANRWLNARWETAVSASNEFEAQIRIVAQPDIRLIADITMALADMKVSLLQINTQKKGNDTMLVNLTVGCKNIGHYDSIVSRLRNIRSVLSANGIRTESVGSVGRRLRRDCREMRKRVSHPSRGGKGRYRSRCRCSCRKAVKAPRF